MIANSVIIALFATVVFAQADDDHTHFEVASIRPVAHTVPLHYTGPNTGDPGRIAWARISLKELIQDAYQGEYPEYGAYRVEISGPAWIEDWYSLTAKIPPGSSDKALSLMLRNLVVERFGLKFHDRSRAAEGFELIVGEHGFKLDSTPLSDQDQQRFPVLTQEYSWRTSYDRRLGVIRASFRQNSLRQLANMLSLTYTDGGVLVIDKTEINGRFDFHLTLPIPTVTILPPAMAARMPDYRPPDDPGTDLRGISGTLEKQTGLRLKSVKLTLRTMVIDSVAKTPTDN